MFENPRRGRQARQMFRKFYISNRLPNRYSSENCRWVPLNWLNKRFSCKCLLQCQQRYLIYYLFWKKKVNYAINLLVYAKLIRLHVLSLLLLKISRQKSNFCDVFAYPIKMIFACYRKERHQTNNLPFRFGYQTIHSLHSQSYCRFHILLL